MICCYYISSVRCLFLTELFATVEILIDKKFVTESFFLSYLLIITKNQISMMRVLCLAIRPT
jgi:hypothetical protein